MHQSHLVLKIQLYAAAYTMHASFNWFCDNGSFYWDVEFHD